jgi:hypothetical protein
MIDEVSVTAGESGEIIIKLPDAIGAEVKAWEASCTEVTLTLSKKMTAQIFKGLYALAEKKYFKGRL